MAARVALLAALVVLAGAEGDAFALVQRSLRSNEAGVWKSLYHLTSAFGVGDHLEFRVTASRWVNCTVLTENHDRYTIHVPAFPQGRQDVPDVGVSSLRDPRKEEERRRMREKAEVEAEKDAKRREVEEAQLFEDWEDVLLAGQGKAAGRWFPARILSRGQYPGTFDIRYNGQRVRNVRSRMLRKTHAVHFDICEQVEVKVANGSWLQSKVLGVGSDVGLLNIRYPGSLDKELQDIPILALRKVSALAAANASEAANASGAANASAATNTSGAPEEGATAGEVNVSAANATTATSAEGAAEAGGEGAQLVEAEDPEVAGGSHADTKEREPLPAYEAGQQLLVQLHAGRGSKPWVSCTVVGPSTEPGMYHVRVDVRVPAYDLCDVPVDRLREPEEVLRERAEAAKKLRQEAEAKKAADAEEARKVAEEEAMRQQEEDRVKQEAEKRAKEDAQHEALRKVQDAAAYMVGQTLQFNHQGSRWVNCTVIGLGLKPDQYNIYVPSFPEGLREIHEVRAQALRSPADIEQRRAEAVQAKQQAAEDAAAAALRAHSFEPEDRVQVKSTNGDWANAVIKAKDPKPNWYSINVGGQTVKVHSSVLRRDYDHEFEDGERVEIRTKELNNSWLPCTVLRKGALPNTYNIYFEHGRVGHRDMHNIDSRALRRLKFLLGQGVEVFMPIGSGAGIWVEGNITGTANSAQDTYDVRIYDDAEERNLSKVPYKRLRQSEAANAAYREQLRLQAEARQRELEREERRANATRTWLAEHTFEDGESVQVRGSGAAAGTWVNVTIIGKGVQPHSYNVAWRNGIVFKDVERKNLRKDNETQAAKVRAAADVVARMQDLEAARLAKVKAEAAAEEAAARAREVVGEANVLESEATQKEKEEAEVEVVSEEKLKELVEQTRFVEQMRQALLEAQDRERQLHQPKSTKSTEEDDVERRQAEWEAALKADEESQGGSQDEVQEGEKQPDDGREEDRQGGSQEEEAKQEKQETKQEDSQGSNQEEEAKHEERETKQEEQEAKQEEGASQEEAKQEEKQDRNQEEEVSQEETQSGNSEEDVKQEVQGGNPEEEVKHEGGQDVNQEEEAKQEEKQAGGTGQEESRQPTMQTVPENSGAEEEELS